MSADALGAEADAHKPALLGIIDERRNSARIHAVAVGHDYTVAYIEAEGTLSHALDVARALHEADDPLVPG